MSPSTHPEQVADDVGSVPPSNGGRAAQGRAERRGRVIAVAMKMANEGGYEAVQMREVAERAGVSLGTIYRYFNGKDDLLIAGLQEWVHVVRTQREAAPVAGDGPADRLAGVLAGAAQSIERAPVLIGALITALMTTDTSTVDLKRAVEGEVQGLIAAAIGDEPDIDVAGVSRVIGLVWLASISRWVGGLAPDGSVEDELRHAVAMLVPARAGTDRGAPVSPSSRG